MQTSDIISVLGGGKIKSSICGAICFPCLSIPDTQGKSEHSVNTSAGFHYYCLVHVLYVYTGMWIMCHKQQLHHLARSELKRSSQRV